MRTKKVTGSSAVTGFPSVAGEAFTTKLPVTHGSYNTVPRLVALVTNGRSPLASVVGTALPRHCHLPSSACLFVADQVEPFKSNNRTQTSAHKARFHRTTAVAGVAVFGWARADVGAHPPHSRSSLSRLVKRVSTYTPITAVARTRNGLGEHAANLLQQRHLLGGHHTVLPVCGCVPSC